MIEHTVRLTGEPGTFQATSHSEWIGRLVDVTGLDPAMHHVLRAVENTTDGTASTLTLSTYSDHGPDLDAVVSVRVGTPLASIQAYVNGTKIADAQLEAPLQIGQPVRVAGQMYTVQAVSYPARQPDGSTLGDDYQRVDLTAAVVPALVADRGPAPAPAPVSNPLGRG